MTQPDVAISDYVVFLFCLFFAFRLYKNNDQSLFSKYWILFFLSNSCASLLGGTVHGFFFNEHTFLHQLLWKPTMLFIGISTVCVWMIGGIIINGNISKWRFFSNTLFIIYSIIIIFFVQKYIVAILFYLPSILFLLSTCVIGFWKTHARSFLWIIAGLLIAIVAAIIQQTKFGLDPVYFNYNVAYHLLQLIGFYFGYKGALSYPRIKV